MDVKTLRASAARVGPDPNEGADRHDQQTPGTYDAAGRRPSGHFELPDAIPEGGRNDGLFRTGSSLRARGADVAEIEAELLQVNDSLCDPPLDVGEVRAIARSAGRYERGSKTAGQSGAGRGFRHDEFGDAMIAEDHVRFIDGAPAVWCGTSYEVGRDAVFRAMDRRKRDITERQRLEVYRFLELEAPRVPMGDDRYIAFKNGVLDVETLDLLTNSPDLNVPNLIPHDWNPEAACVQLDGSLDEWACGDGGTRTALEEAVGLCLYRGRRLACCPVLIGTGANGKSTYLNFLRRLLGIENTSAMDIADIGKRFQSVTIMGKLANIGDDISSDFITASALATVKKSITGDEVSAEYKGGKTFSFRPYCTLIFSCNDMPRLGDRSEGMRRRLVPIAFRAVFGSPGRDRDLGRERELDTEAAYERAIYLGVQALRGCLERGSMTKTKDQDELSEEIHSMNDSVYDFCVTELGFKSPNIVNINGKSTRELYEQYVLFCERTGVKHQCERNFVQGVNRTFGAESVLRYYQTGRQRHEFVLVRPPEV